MPSRELIVASLLLASNVVPNVESFTTMPRVVPPLSSHVSLEMAGRGMGMGVASKKTKKKNKKGMGGGKSKGMGGGGSSKKNSVPPFDVNASMLRLEKRYEEIMKVSAKSMAKEEEDPRWSSNTDDDDDDSMTTEYVITARADTKQGGALRDWIPIAQLCVQRPETEYENTKEILQEAVSTYCRELSYVAAYGAPVFSTVPRNVVQYGVEPMDSFYKHVYDCVVEPGTSGSTASAMTKVEARNILGLDDPDTIDKSSIKQAYRKLSFELHPDRLADDLEEESKKAAADRYSQVQLAFEALSSGVREEGSSWYESLGGKARTDFIGPVNLLPLGAAQAQIERRGIEAAVLGLDPELVQSFVARNLGSQ